MNKRSSVKLLFLLAISFFLFLNACNKSSSSGGNTNLIDPNKDYTMELQLKPGMIFQGNTIEGRTISGKLIGDYDVVYFITDTDGKNFTFRWAMSYPSSMRGIRTIDYQDRQTTHRYSSYYFNGERGVKKGYSSVIFPTEVYNKLKSGEKTEFFTDGPESSKSIEKIGEDKMDLLLNETRITVRVLKAKTDNNMIFSILDNPNLPLSLKKETPLTTSATTAIIDLSTFSKQFVENLKQKKEMTTRAIYFSFNAPVLQEESRYILEEIGNYLKNNPKSTLTVEVHTDNVGGSPFNLDLSQRRAENIKTYLLAKYSILSNQVEARGFGDMKPIMDNSTYLGRAMNRRVVFRMN